MGVLEELKAKLQQLENITEKPAQQPVQRVPSRRVTHVSSRRASYNTIPHVEIPPMAPAIWTCPACNNTIQTVYIPNLCPTCEYINPEGDLAY